MTTIIHFKALNTLLQIAPLRRQNRRMGCQWVGRLVVRRPTQVFQERPLYGAEFRGFSGAEVDGYSTSRYSFVGPP